MQFLLRETEVVPRAFYMMTFVLPELHFPIKRRRKKKKIIDNHII
jgi:hypothetical protein